MTAARADFKKYVLVFCLTLSLALMVLVGASLYIQPLEGELTRMGSYAERDFGWNLPQRKIRGDARLVSAYDGKSVVLIVGDSFSTNGVWQPFFRQKTGLSYETLNIRQTSFHELIESEQFVKNPPRVMIVECVERELIFFFKDLNFRCGSGPRHNKAGAPLLQLAEDTDPEYYMDIRKTVDFRNVNLKYTAMVILNSVLRGIFGNDSGTTRRFGLTDRTLFSNRKNDEILIYEGDLNRLLWKNKDLAKAACSIRGLQDKIESNGKTLFIFMLAPDKSTAYAEYIKNPLFRNAARTGLRLVNYGINAPSIDLMLKREIDRGEKDIYCPSGTHWSAHGYEVAATGMADFIREHIFRNAPHFY